MVRVFLNTGEGRFISLGPSCLVSYTHCVYKYRLCGWGHSPCYYVIVYSVSIRFPDAMRRHTVHSLMQFNTRMEGNFSFVEPRVRLHLESYCTARVLRSVHRSSCSQYRKKIELKEPAHLF